MFRVLLYPSDQIGTFTLKRIAFIKIDSRAPWNYEVTVALDDSELLVKWFAECQRLKMVVIPPDEAAMTADVVVHSIEGEKSPGGRQQLTAKLISTCAPRKGTR